MEDDTWQLKRSMTPLQLGRVTRQLGLNKAQTGRYTGVKIRRIFRMFDGEAEIPVSMALLLHSLAAHNEKPLVPKWRKE